MTLEHFPGQDGVRDGTARRTVSVAYTALGWVAVFFAFHVYWYLGGSFASPGKLPPAPHAMIARTLGVVVSVAFPLGALVCLSIARGWARGRLAAVTTALVRVGWMVLLLRGSAGILDDLTRATGLLSNGITRLSLQDTTGHAHLRWSDWAIDAYFLTGGIIFWVLAVRHRGQHTAAGRRSARGMWPAFRGTSS
jgi:hypothetical protein